LVYLVSEDAEAGQLRERRGEDQVAAASSISEGGDPGYLEPHRLHQAEGCRAHREHRGVDSEHLL
jgi:hypothetical protein